MKLGMLIGVVAASVLMVLLCGTPHYLSGAIFCEYGPDDLQCLPPVRCTYVGWQGHREMRFNDGNDCPLLLLLPARIHSEAAPAPISARHLSRQPAAGSLLSEQKLPYGPGGPLEPPKKSFPRMSSIYVCESQSTSSFAARRSSCGVSPDHIDLDHAEVKPPPGKR